MARNWYVIRIQPRAECMAKAELSRAGYEVLLPRVETFHSHAGHDDVPLFPGYLFLRCDLAEGVPLFYRIAPHVSGWVNFGGVPPPLPDDLMAALKQRLVTIGQEGGLWRRFRRGEKVRIVGGKLQDLAEVLEEPKSPRARVRVLLEFMGQLVTAQVPWENLRPAEEEHGPNIRSPRRTRGRGRWIQGFGERAVPASA